MEEFQLSDEQSSSLRFQQEKPYLIRLILQSGLASTDTQAQYMLAGVAVLCLAISAFVLYRSTSVHHPSQAQLEQAGKYLETYGSASTEAR